MRIIKAFGRLSSGEPHVWWSWQNLSKQRQAERQKKGTVDADKPDPWPKHGRAWLHWYNNDSDHNSIGVEWNLFSRSCGLSLSFADIATGDQAISLGIRIPFIVSLWLSLGRIKWVEKLPGVDFVYGKFGTGRRELSISFLDKSIWWKLWIDSDGGRSNWRDGCFHFDDFLLGRAKYRESDRIVTQTHLDMPEGNYPCTVELYTATWKRSRWPWPQTIQRANVIIPDGVPVPGSWESSYNCDDDAIYETTLPASTFDQAITKVKESVIDDRIRYADQNWIPDAGWPAHCIQERNHGRF